MMEITGAFTILPEELDTGMEHSVMSLVTFYRFGKASDVARVSLRWAKGVDQGGPKIGKQWLAKAAMPSRHVMKEHLSDEFLQLDMLLTCPCSVCVGREKTVVYSFDLSKYQQFQLRLFQLEMRCQQAIQISRTTMSLFLVWGERGEGIEEEWWNGNDYEIMAILYRIEVENWTAALERIYDFKRELLRLSISMEKGQAIGHEKQGAETTGPPAESSASRRGEYSTGRKLF
ncbi:hypothetical protein C8J56DRAFT_900209 [Mycena floridula]|nr:hypothetical protein C8J56DRAFT_900209 [Mycena floridula]